MTKATVWNELKQLGYTAKDLRDDLDKTFNQATVSELTELLTILKTPQQLEVDTDSFESSFYSSRDSVKPSYDVRLSPLGYDDSTESYAYSIEVERVAEDLPVSDKTEVKQPTAKVFDNAKHVNRLGGTTHKLRSIASGISPIEALSNYTFREIPEYIQKLNIELKGDAELSPSKVATHILSFIATKVYVPNDDKDKQGFMIAKTRQALDSLIDKLDIKTQAYISHPVRLLAYLMEVVLRHNDRCITWSDNDPVLSASYSATLKELVKSTKFNNSALHVENYADKTKVNLGSVLDLGKSAYRMKESADMRRKSSYAKKQSSRDVEQLGDLAELHPALWRRVSSNFYIRLNADPYLPKRSWDITDDLGKNHHIRLGRIDHARKQAVLTVDGNKTIADLTFPMPIIGNRYRAIVNPIRDSFPTICNIEISFTPWDRTSWQRIGRLVCGKKSILNCKLDAGVMQQHSKHADQIVIGLKMLSLIADTDVKPAIRSCYDSVITDLRLPEIQALLGVTLEYNASNPTLPYKVKSLLYARKDIYTLEIRKA